MDGNYNKKHQSHMVKTFFFGTSNNNDESLAKKIVVTWHNYNFMFICFVCKGFFNFQN